MSSETQTAYMSAEWWGNYASDTTVWPASSDNTSIGVQSITDFCTKCGSYDCRCWQNNYTTTYWYPFSQPQKKIKLTLTEVEHLRKLAAEDERLRETMKKFAPMIEIEVDFPGGDDVQGS